MLNYLHISGEIMPKYRILINTKQPNGTTRGKYIEVNADSEANAISIARSQYPDSSIGNIIPPAKK
jgi:hypothetical protein